mmetsp:Transcript_738/g.1546  ORF Transcript_738/g.1546 Transcript_738/m.1546 type:complete len:203 (+) Transcript_738:495-1103(+)
MCALATSKFLTTAKCSVVGSLHHLARRRQLPGLNLNPLQILHLLLQLRQRRPLPLRSIVQQNGICMVARIPEPPSATRAMYVQFRIVSAVLPGLARHAVLQHEVDRGQVQSARGDVGGHEHPRHPRRISAKGRDGPGAGRLGHVSVEDVDGHVVGRGESFGQFAGHDFHFGLARDEDDSSAGCHRDNEVGGQCSPGCGGGGH